MFSRVNIQLEDLFYRDHRLIYGIKYKITIQDYFFLALFFFISRSIIGRTILSSDDNNQTNGTRSRTIIEQDIDNLLDVYRF